MFKGLEKILIVKPSSLGDIVQSLPFLSVVKENFPHIKIHWLVAKEYEDLLKGHSLIQKVITINKNKWKKIKKLSDTIKELHNLYKSMKEEKYQVTIDLQGLLRSGIIAMLSGAQIKVGFRESRELSSIFYNKKVSASINNHAVFRYLEIAKNLGCKINGINFPLPDEETPEFLKNFENYIVIIPSARWQSKNWPLPYYVELVKMLPYSCIIIGSKKDEEDAMKIEKYSEGKAKSFAGKTTLRQLIAVFKRCLFVISPDTGTMHLAVASGKKVVAIFGPTSPLRTGPFGEGHLIIKSNLPCSPCFKKFCNENICMKEITPKFVYNKIETWRSI